MSSTARASALRGRQGDAGVIPFRLLSPRTGLRLAKDTPHSLADPSGERWPVIDGIPYLRASRDALVIEVVGLLDQDRADDALVLLLADQDAWWTGPRPSEKALRKLVRERRALSLREAVDHLAWGRVGDYVLHRWSDPTFLAGLALLEAHWNEPRCVFELACGTGPYLRELQNRGYLVSGGDVVFAKLWVARHWILEGRAQLFCFDAGAGWPIAGAPVDLVMCHDAFYFLEPKPKIAACLRETAGEEGWLVISHIHNRDRPGYSAGHAMSADEIDEIFPDALVYDDADLTTTLVEARAPTPRAASKLRHAEAFSIVFGPGMRPAPRAVKGGLAMPKAGRALRRNPLYVTGKDGAHELRWPSDRYRDEYGPRATYPPRSAAPDTAVMAPEWDEPARRREIVDLPERWG